LQFSKVWAEVFFWLFSGQFFCVFLSESFGELRNEMPLAIAVTLAPPVGLMLDRAHAAFADDILHFSDWVLPIVGGASPWPVARCG
jgi:hypothetical protein